MRLQLAPFRPVIGFVVVNYVAEQETFIALVNNQPEVAADPHRPEVFVLGFIESVKLHPGVSRVDPQVEGGRLDSLLLVTGQARETVGEGVGDAEVRHFSFPLPDFCYRGGEQVNANGHRDLGDNARS